MDGSAIARRRGGRLSRPVAVTVAGLFAAGAAVVIAAAQRPGAVGGPISIQQSGTGSGKPATGNGRAPEPVAQSPLPSAHAPMDSESLSLAANQIMGLTASKVVTLAVDATPNRPINAAVEIEGQPYTLALAPHSIRAPGYQLLAQVADGSLVPMDPGPERMLRGELIESPGSSVAGGLLEDGLHAVITMPTGERRWIEPLADRVPGAAADQYVLYRGEDVIKNGGTCGVDADWLALHPPTQVQGGGGGGGSGGGTDGAAVSCTELAIDADFEYFQHYGSSTVNVQNRINLVINTMDNQYINQVDIDHIITAIIVRTAEPDPYSSTDANTLLTQFRNEWLTNQAAIPRDVAQLFTGKSIAGSTIGLAWTIGGVCTSSGYCLVESDCCGSLACSTDLSAHELGHLWGAFHCSSSCSSTMNPSITCVNTFMNSNPDSIAAIVAFRNTRTCLSACADASLPYVEPFPTTAFDPAKWWTIQGAATIDTVGINEPSAPNSMRLRGSTGAVTQARTARINTAGLAVLQLDYKYERTGGGDPTEAGDDLVVEYFNSVGNWVEISRQLGSGAAMTNYAMASVQFPADAMHSEFRLRFRNISPAANSDDWFVDDISLTGVAVPANDNCANATLKSGSGSTAFTTLGASTDGPDEPGSCNFGGYTQVGSDVWYKFVAVCTGTTTVSLCGANYNTKLAIYGACPSGSGQAIACNDDFCGTSSQVSFPTTMGTLYRVRIGGFNGATGSGTMVISCVSAPNCPADTNGDGQVNVTDLLAVINAWGPCGGCPADTNGDGQVNVTDLLAIINGWGPACP